MSFEDWALQFCLTCDKQTDDGAAYCSESCRLADYETNSASSSGPSSPSLNGPSFDWSFNKSTPSSNQSYLSPASNFSTQSSRTLSPSSSHTSLCSMKSTSSAGLSHSHSGMSEKAARELQAYAHSFESVRLQRRRSSN
ncbi:hypothetical protein NEUTE1DRAFT_95325 [Neurospora tetrasperma FGSC 2508]|uniref:Life-span regulatory factor domain-containing protein n=1 Tax=Neurospora tetrasperma (strain FGSC 2508 / ATCC MYA-4615 / P0657) TaxID=510951 RepID=F8MQK1_NEUT8|nr:uncharacterized protein NEUTE1DRAFT_95325 [Neurospora tetrasperma FGSC 2508]EGO56631.1 hypothetical protein NEUTE1DRAFT_95325 [Neurospora tetrasperma FGSC 2508]EGZ70495.1 hypothetical protein NEUTE2DRAFT_121711 [Neurospora tetrasperma FGSC 2509]KAK3488334.1 hypothetical protein B0T13DRAFT_105485 [Neurospora crassa]